MIAKLFLSLTSAFFLSSSLCATDIPQEPVDGDEVQVHQHLQSTRYFKNDQHAYVLKIEGMEWQDPTIEDGDTQFLKSLKSFQIERFDTNDHYWSAQLVEVKEALIKEIWPFQKIQKNPAIEVGSTVRILTKEVLKIGDRISCGQLIAFSIPGEAEKEKQHIYFANNLHPVSAEKTHQER